MKLVARERQFFILEMKSSARFYDVQKQSKALPVIYRNASADSLSCLNAYLYDAGYAWLISS